MKIKRLIFFGLLIATKVINAQTDFRPGYIINISGDTLYGKIDYRGDLLMSYICRFKNIDNTIIEYSPNDIIAYRFVDSKYFVSREIKNKNIFFEYLIKGKVNIYYFRDDKGDHYYIDKEGMKLTEIPYKEEKIYINRRPIYYESKKHIGLLRYYMQDTPEFQSRIDSLKKPDHQNLIKLAEDYHNALCEGEKCIIYEKGYSSTNVTFEPFWGLTKYKGYDKSINELGGYLYLWAPRVNEKLFFKTGLVYQKISEDSWYLKIFKIPVQFQYMNMANKLQPKVSFGINYINLNFNEYKYFGRTLSLNVGLNYKIDNFVSLSISFNTDYTSIIDVIMNEDLKFDLVSYTINIGLLIDL